jgi:hypothetical protein
VKKVGIFAFLPFVVFALEQVNLIKDASFEKENEVWHTQITWWHTPYLATVSAHDAENSFTGWFSGSGDTRSDPGFRSRYEQAIITQGFLFEKTIEDIDSLTVAYTILPLKNDFDNTYAVSVLLNLNVTRPDKMKAGYALLEPDTILAWISPPVYYLEQVDQLGDTTWHLLERNIRQDIKDHKADSIPLNSTVDSIVLCCTGTHSSSDWVWHGQKVFFDDVRLMGYADFDVGIKEITSGEVVSPGVPYTPEARIKNFGREDADDFWIILTIEDSTGIMRIDTVPYTLPADTEDTLAFDPVTFSVPGTYYLHIRTEMEPDECDEDDEKSLQISVTGVEEPVTHQPDKVNLDVSLVRAEFRVSYSIPAGQTGTITLYNSAGQRIESKTVQGAGETVMCEDLSSGVYFVRLDAPDYSLSHKVVVVQ